MKLLALLRHACVLGLALIPLFAAELVVPRYKVSQTVLRPSDYPDKNYYLAPNLVRISDREILITIKRGSSHGWEDEADAEMIRFDTVDNRIVEKRTIGHVPGRKFQLTMGTLFGDGTLAMFTDFQSTGHDGRHYREGMRVSRSSDRGASFGPWQEVGLIDGIEYGYPFDFIVEKDAAYLLTMSFGYRPGGRWSVAVLKSTDHGRRWNFVRDLTAEFGGFRINESGFLRQGDGFLVVTRGYDNAVRVQRTDGQFRMLQQVNLTETCPLVNDYIGWPRIFQRDGRIYLLGRNWTEKPAKILPTRPAHFPGLPDNQQLCLLRLNAASLTVERVVTLDNDGGHLPVIDGYYGVPYWQERDGREWFNAITYRAIGLNLPDIVRLEFDWAEIR